MSRISISMRGYTAGATEGSTASAEDPRETGLAEDQENPDRDDDSGSGLARHPRRGRETDDEERQRPEGKNIERRQDRVKGRGLAVHEKAEVRAHQVSEGLGGHALLLADENEQERRLQADRHRGHEDELRDPRRSPRDRLEGLDRRKKHARNSGERRLGRRVGGRRGDLGRFRQRRSAVAFGRGGVVVSGRPSIWTPFQSRMSDGAE